MEGALERRTVQAHQADRCRVPGRASRASCSSLGYEIRLTDKEGGFELAHINRAQIEAFSQRSRMIEEALDNRGKTRARGLHA